MMKEPRIFEQQVEVLQVECDAWDRMTPGAVMRRVQELGRLQTEELGWTAAFYREAGVAFVLTRVSLLINDMPTYGQKIRIQARGYGLYQGVFNRVASLYDEGGRMLCEADTRWVLVDLETHHMAKEVPQKLAWVERADPAPEQHDIAMRRPDTPLIPLAALHATYSMCDGNRHINNTHYVDMVCDHLPLERMAAGLPKKILLAFRRELRLGESFTLSGGTLAAGGYYFIAQENDRRNFESYVTF